MATVTPGKGKLVMEQLDSNNEKHTETLGYVAQNLSSNDTLSAAVAEDAITLAQAVNDLTTNSFVGLTANYEMQIESNS